MTRSIRRHLYVLHAYAVISLLVFVGKTGERVASVMLADDRGRNRLALTVTPDGRASIEFLDEQGNVVQKISPSRGERSSR